MAFLSLPYVIVMFLCGFCILFTKPINIYFSKNNFKTESDSTIHTFKNYFATVFLIFSNKRYPDRPKCHFGLLFSMIGGRKMS